MTIKQQIKKWHIVILIILGISGYWILQNLWVFEKQIPVEEYEEFLVDTRWQDMTNGEGSFIEFENYLYKIYLKETPSEVFRNGTWKINQDTLIINFDNFNLNVKEKILFLTKSNMILLYTEPGPGGFLPINKYIKV